MKNIIIKIKSYIGNFSNNIISTSKNINPRNLYIFSKYKNRKFNKKIKTVFSNLISSQKEIYYNILDYVNLFKESESGNNSENNDVNLLPPPPIWSRVMIWSFGSGSIFLILWSIFTTVEETVMLQGEITTNKAAVSLSTRDSGRLKLINVEPFQFVENGDALLVISDDETLPRIASITKRLRFLESKRKKDLDIYNFKIKQTEEQIDLDKFLLVKYYDLSLAGAVSKFQYLQKETEFKQKLLEIESIKKESESSLLSIKEKTEELKNTVDELILKAKRFIITAPVDGYIQDIKYQTPGERIQSGEVLITIIPNSDLIARIKIPSNLSAPVEINSEASLNVDAYPNSDFGSVIASVVSVSPMSNQTSNQATQKTYTADLLIIAAESPDLLDLKLLRPGMGLTARIKLREKPIIASVFEILSGLFDPLTEKR